MATLYRRTSVIWTSSTLWPICSVAKSTQAFRADQLTLPQVTITMGAMGMSLLLPSGLSSVQAWRRAQTGDLGGMPPTT